MNKISSTLYLKTLTEKSVIPVGKIHRFETVGDLINNKRYEYLRYLYYTTEKLTFVDTVLNKIGIVDDYRIDKPGVNLKKYFKCSINTIS